MHSFFSTAIIRLLFILSIAIYQFSIASDDQQTADPIQTISINQKQPAQKHRHKILTFSQQQVLDQSLESPDSLLDVSEPGKTRKKQTKKTGNKESPVSHDDEINTIDPIMTDF